MWVREEINDLTLSRPFAPCIVPVESINAYDIIDVATCSVYINAVTR